MTEAWPEDLLASNHRKWRTLSEREWGSIRHAYQAGVPARDLADRHEIGLSTMRQTAREGGWRRADRSFDSDLFPADADRRVDDRREDRPDDIELNAAALEAQDWDGMLSLAQLRLRRALQAGQATEAGSWMRLYDRLAANRARCSNPEPDPQPASNAEPEAEPEHQPEPETLPEPAPEAKPASTSAITLNAVQARMRGVESIARRALRAAARGDGSGIEALEAEVRALEAMADALPNRASPAAPSDSSDSLDPVFSPPVDFAAERLRLTTLRRRRLDLGLGVADIDAALSGLVPPDD